MRRIRWRVVLIASYAAFNVIVLPRAIRLGPDISQDWGLWLDLQARLDANALYDVRDEMWFAWSPLLAPVMVAVTTIGYWPWVATHLVSVALLRARLLVFLVLVSYSYWVDVAQGNTFTFVFVAGALAFRGSHGASLVYLALCLLMPRPIQLPLMGWLLVTNSSLRLPFAAMFVVHAGAVAITGYAGPWLEALTRTTSVPWDMGPISAIGPAWLLVGVPLGVLLASRGRPGWAGLAVSPYIIPQYLLWPLLEFGSSAVQPGKESPAISSGRRRTQWSLRRG